MTRVYAKREDTGERILAFLECDGKMCGAKIYPHKEIAESGWTKLGSRQPDGEVFEYDYCEQCSRRFTT